MAKIASRQRRQVKKQQVKQGVVDNDREEPVIAPDQAIRNYHQQQQKQDCSNTCPCRQERQRKPPLQQPPPNPQIESDDPNGFLYCQPVTPVVAKEPSKPSK